MQGAQLLNLPEAQHPTRARFDAARLHSLIDILGAHVAFAGFPFRRVEYRRVIRAGHNAHAAADTPFVILDHNAVGTFGIGASRAHFQTLRVVAVVAGHGNKALGIGVIHLFNGTLRDNLLCGASYVDDETMLRVAEATGVHDFARRHPSGYNMQVGERGMNLSGGQRQAITLARSLLLDPPVLLMDEPTSSMDNTSEDLIKKALQPFISDKTVLLVTHRASMLSLVDRLIILDNGKIIADGPKETVMNALKKGQIHANR